MIPLYKADTSTFSPDLTLYLQITFKPLIMKLKIILPAIVLFSLGFTQLFSQDSTKILKKQQQMLTVEKRLVDNKIKLETLQKSLINKSDDLDKSLNDVQKSADKNKDAADELQNDATSKKQARRSKNAAKDAKRSSKQARKAGNSKSGVESDIKSLEKTIKKDETELEKLRTQSLSAVIPTPAV